MLFTPPAINSVTLANRIVMSPMAALAPNPDGHPSDQTVAFLSERAKGGVGRIIMGGMAVTRRAVEEAPVKGVRRLDEDRFVPDLRRVTDAVHASTRNPRMGSEGRRRGERPSIDRLIKAPIEQAMVAAVGSPRLMNVGKIARKRS